jgi:hypothetical protein
LNSRKSGQASLINCESVRANQSEANVAARLIIPAVALMVVCAVGARAQTPELPPMSQLGAGDKFQGAKLPRQEVEQIIAQVETTSFDWPDSWDSELRIRRVSLGDQEGVIVQGTNLLCGGSGNCQTWILHQLEGRWTGLLENQAHLISGFGLLPNLSNGIRDLVTVTNAGGNRDLYTFFVFDGSRYRERRCYEAVNGKEKPGTMTSAPCAARFQSRGRVRGN